MEELWPGSIVESFVVCSFSLFLWQSDIIAEMTVFELKNLFRGINFFQREGECQGSEVSSDSVAYKLIHINKTVESSRHMKGWKIPRGRKQQLRAAPREARCSPHP